MERALAKTNGHGSIEDLYLAHSRDAVHLAYMMTGDRALAEDLAQDAFVKLLGHFAHMRRPEAFRAYLFRTVANRCKSHFRRQRVATRYVRAQMYPQQTNSDIETRDALHAVLVELPHRQRAALVLRFCEDLPEQEVADILRTTPKAIRSLVGRGLAALRERGEELR